MFCKHIWFFGVSPQMLLKNLIVLLVVFMYRLKNFERTFFVVFYYS